VEEFATVLRRYGLSKVCGDRYAAEWVTEAFRKCGITYEPAVKTKSEIYLEVEPLFAQCAVQLLDVRRLHTELRQLERRTGAGKDRVDHPPRAHDDYANAAAGALFLAKPSRPVDYARDVAVITADDGRSGMEQRFRELEHGAVTGEAPWDLN
jgi:hypothetical protein